jgi:hypothetical protein
VFTKRIVLRLALAAVVLIGLLLYRSGSRNNLNVTPEAKREIEKARLR